MSLNDDKDIAANERVSLITFSCDNLTQAEKTDCCAFQQSMKALTKDQRLLLDDDTVASHNDDHYHHYQPDDNERCLRTATTLSHCLSNDHQATYITWFCLGQKSATTMPTTTTTTALIEEPRIHLATICLLLEQYDAFFARVRQQREGHVHCPSSLPPFLEFWLNVPQPHGSLTNEMIKKSKRRNFLSSIIFFNDEDNDE